MNRWFDIDLQLFFVLTSLLGFLTKGVAVVLGKVMFLLDRTRNSILTPAVGTGSISEF